MSDSVEGIWSSSTSGAVQAAAGAEHLGPTPADASLSDTKPKSQTLIFRNATRRQKRAGR